ncbi:MULTISPECIES: type II secretion system protein [unclassified Candidatus Frackibacter]|uniref:type II secretion system protein n=1 Tax=unclassified Candidatus Frackibacter TaxID=2648818 RepID=UPI000891EF25|nr:MULTISPECIES: prepilin-type N-terminal cleavage/methylation domain-containing protein [unclassified Candidatus Frackibacter]SDC03609.1 general secretion pathway protein G [Candidatus Frackibacter sp. WG11]SEM68824.1 general secretion pathway protein G [Candidatus Frackibacter sp. WG12]SFL80127.1 general secretion pathway protein G [Candidatus Frackibacter sp. WG13]
MISKLRERICNVAKREEGFTLIELMIVIAVLGILAGIAIPKFSGVQDKAKDANITSVAGTIRSAMEMYNAENGNYPASVSGSTAKDKYNDLDITLDTVELPDISDVMSTFTYTGDSDGDGTNDDYKITIKSSATETTYTIEPSGVTETPAP